MNSGDVTRQGIRGERPPRQALVGQGLDGPRPDGRGADGRAGGRRRRRGRKGEQLMVPEAEFSSYYGRPVVKAPAWSARDIAGYFFLGGLAGAGSVLAAGAALTGRPRMARAMKISSLAAVSGSTGLLIHDLGRPGRFANMLRVVKPTSPMSVGSWLLAAYGPAAGAAAVLDVWGRLPRLERTATGAAALLGPAVAAYTAVLAADTAVPGWHDGYRQMPFVFTGSAAVAASGMALAAAPVRENGPARGAAVFGAAVEVAATQTMEHRMGLAAETYRTGKGGRYLRAAKALSVAGAAGAALLGHRSRTAAAVSGAALLAASACTRLGVFHAGIASAEDPRYTVVPQRERLERRRAREREQADGAPGQEDTGS
ncbi:NrfD/PsrC family molybdoenzyme membrane anchor subunit [Streptomyces sp. TRM70308]|uniref:NrfD/PsrC family molybdoenzyme membrane anchor subunit n=1 Tax=Streptomyces sp. TRM70308 TaxID=3131932 RepID=UPI003D024B52